MDINGNNDSKISGRFQTSPTTSEADEASGSYANEYPASFKLVAQITFAMLSYIVAVLVAVLDSLGFRSDSMYIHIIAYTSTTISSVAHTQHPQESHQKAYSIFQANTQPIHHHSSDFPGHHHQTSCLTLHSQTLCPLG